MLNFKNEYFTLEKGRLKYPTQFKDKSFLVVYGSKEGGVTGTELTAHIYKIPENYYEINAGQLDFSNYPNGIENDFLTIRVTNLDSLFSLPLNFTDWKDISPENLTTTFEKIGVSILDIQKRLSEVAIYIDSGKPDQINLPKLPVGCTWYKDQDENIVALPISDLYGKFRQMIDKLHKDIKDLLDIDYGKLSDNLKKELAKHLLTLEEALGKHKDSLDDYTLEKIEEIKATCDRIIGLAFSKLTKADTIEDLKTMRFLKVGDIVEVLGYYTAGDGANHKRIIASEDDGSGVQLSNGLWANIVHNGEVKTSWFGIKDDESIDDTPTFNKILNYADNIFVDRNVNVDKVILPSNKTIYGKKISAVQIQLGYKCTIRDINLFPKNTLEDIPFLYINGNDFRNTKSGISIKNIVILGKIEQVERDLFVTEVENDGIWDITIDNIKSVDKINFRTLFKFKAHHSKNAGDVFTWITYVTISNISIYGGINVFELLTYYNEDGEYGNTNGKQKIRIQQVKVMNCHIENGGKAKTLLRLGNEAEIVMDQTLIGDFNRYSADNSTYIIIDNRNRKTLSACRLNAHIESWELDAEKRYSQISFLDNENKIDLFDYKSNITNYYNLVDFPKTDIFSMLNRLYQFNYNYFVSTERYFIIAKFSKKSISSYVLLTYILTNTGNESTHNVNFFSFACRANIETAKMDTNLTTLKSLLLYEKGDVYYLVLKANKDNRLNAHICNAFLVSRKLYTYFWEGTQEEFDTLGLTLTKEITISNAAQVSQLNTLYHAEKMKQEGVYNDYITYMDDKTLYDKKQEKLEEQRYLAYQEMLKENPNLSYEEFMRVQPMTLNLVEEPQPSQALREFMEKYL